MTEKKRPKREISKKTPRTSQSGGMEFVVNRKKDSGKTKAKGERIFETKGTGPKNNLIDKNE